MAATHRATAANTIGSMIQRGGPTGRWSAKKMRFEPPTSMLTSKSRTIATKTERATAAHGNRDRSERLAHRKPRPMPRKLPTSTKFEK